MNKYFKIVVDGYIELVGTGDSDVEISTEEYETILAVISAKPAPLPGYDYRLRTDLTWELHEVPPVAEEDMEATEEDYISALEELGVTVNEEI